MDFIDGSMKCCGTCRSFQPETDNELQGAGLGVCAWSPGPRDLPAAWFDSRGKAKCQSPRYPVVCEEEGMDCTCWVPLEKQERELQ